MKNFNLIKEMNETVDIIKNFNENNNFINLANKDIFITGEGSSRIFPAKNLIDYKLKNNINLHIETQGSRQANLYNLDNYNILCASNSGSTKELITLLSNLNNNNIYAVTATDNSKIFDYSNKTHLLNCGAERAVAASKSVIEQALFYQSLLGGDEWQNKELASKYFDKALNQEISKEVINTLKETNTIYFAGINNGVAEELALKTSEITRLNGIYLEGTMLLHGVEEVMTKNQAIIVLEPFEDDEEKIQKVLVDNIGIKVIAISSRETRFPTIKIDKLNNFDNYIQLAAGWNILLKIGLAKGINIDKPERARKIGNSI
jgi:glucosamine--fructose-6-phosphate aminotransferase (isomerizing)